MTPAVRLANWVCEHLRQGVEPLTHLKLQKLAFYCYGVALAFNRDCEIGSIDFLAWKHGPVSREIWNEYREFGGNPIPSVRRESVFEYSVETSARLHDVLTVYGTLTAWQLRQESHLEEPWRKAYETGPGSRIPRAEIRDHFTAKFSGHVEVPVHLLRPGNFKLDRIPVRAAPSLRELAQAIDRSLER